MVNKSRAAALILVLASLAFTIQVLAGTLILHAETGKYAWTEYKGSPDRTGYIPHIWGQESYMYRSFRVEWSFHADLCIASSPIIADLNNDGKLEVSFASCDGYEYALSAANGSMLWKTRTGGGLVDPAAWDLDGDGYVEVVVGGSTGMLYAINGSNGSIEWSLRGSFQRAIPTIADVDGDGRPEVVATSMSGDLYVISWNGTVEKRIRIGESALSPPVTGIVGGERIIVATDYHSLIIVHASTWSTTRIRLRGELGGASPVLFDLDGDGEKEALLAGRDRLYAVDLLDNKVLWTASFQGSGISSPSIGDALNTGAPVILYGTDEGLYVYALNGSLIEAMGDVRLGTSSPIIADIDNDGENEVIIGTYDGDILITTLSGKSQVEEGVKWRLETQAPIMAPASIADGDGDGMPEIYVGSRDYNLYCIGGEPIEKKATHSTQTATPQQQEGTRGAGETTTHTLQGTGTPPSQTGGGGIDYRLVAGVAGLLAGITLIVYVWSRRR